MKFCLECGEHLKFLGLSGWSSGIWLYGCPKCNILWEEHGCSVTGAKTEWKKSFHTLSKWEKQKEERKNQEIKEHQKLEEQRACREKLKKEGFPEPIETSAEVMGLLSEGQRQIVFRLFDLVKQEKKLVDDINSRRPNESGILVINEAPKVCEDNDDWKVITFKLCEELKDIREKIVLNLNKALNSGLAHLGIIQRQCANYGVEL